MSNTKIAPHDWRTRISQYEPEAFDIVQPGIGALALVKDERFAVLISAAPDLLAALKDARWRLANLVGPDGAQGLDRSALEKIDAAIAKATGGDARCPLCRYEHGHAIGCKNNPVDKAIAAMAKSTGGEV